LRVCLQYWLNFLLANPESVVHKLPRLI
jgi:hypothetical protein